MRLGGDQALHLTYCTNIHPANGWEAVFANVQAFAPALRDRLAPAASLGIGLRLSGEESAQLLEEGRLAELKSFLDRAGLYVSTLNGFPYGAFHQEPVKSDVHAPDWRTEERVEYTLRLVEILAYLLPPGVEGSISTSPLSYGAWFDRSESCNWHEVTRNLVRVAEAAARLRQARGTLVHLDIEPEPDGVLERGSDVADFFSSQLIPVGAPLLADSLGVSTEEARATLLDHVRVCLDACHAAVCYEDVEATLGRFAQLGIRVGKLQISSALKVAFSAANGDRGEIGRELAAFASSPYLHQVRQRNRDGSLVSYPDLPVALSSIDDPEVAEWRIHFHIPIFIEKPGAFLSSQDELRSLLELVKTQRFTSQLEIETYTWDVLPAPLKSDLGDSIAREFEWVLDVLG